MNKALLVGGARLNGRDEPLCNQAVSDKILSRICLLRAAACYFASVDDNSKGTAAAGPPSDVESGPLVDKDGYVLVDTQLRHKAPEVLFAADANEQNNVGSVVVEAILNVRDLDLRSHMAQTIVCIGGGAAIPGFHQRLSHAVGQELGKVPTFQKLARAAATVPVPAFAADILPWVGASLVASMDPLLENPRCCSVEDCGSGITN